jgi:hypothetical protein
MDPPAPPTTGDDPSGSDDRRLPEAQEAQELRQFESQWQRLRA